MNAPTLPITPLRDTVLDALRRGPVALTAPTGSGKSTEVPRWCARELGRTLVVEPRRVACRSLATHVARLEGTPLGERVGYQVRDDRRATDATAIIYATPGIVLRTLAGGGLDSYAVIIIDELHERSLEMDLLLALLRARPGNAALMVMSATLAGPAVAERLDATLIEGEGRLYPVAIEYLASQPRDRPSGQGIAERVRRALKHAAPHSGDALVFLPGKAEIRACADILRGENDWEVLTLHGGLTLDEQAQAFNPGSKRRCILATNVAETSVTLPRIGIVIDSGLVRQTRYYAGRGHLVLDAIAIDSATQRAGRAGRLRPGVCVRLWGAHAQLSPQTAPEIHRESLVPLILGARACGEDPRTLPWLDPPHEHAIEAAETDLRRLGALDATGDLTERGADLFRWPLDPALGRLLAEPAEGELREALVDLVSALSLGRPLWSPHRPEDVEYDLRACGCDAMALIAAVRFGDPHRHGLHSVGLREARSARKRLRRLWNLKGTGPRTPISKATRDELLGLALHADSSRAYIARRRKRAVAWSNGIGRELNLGRGSALNLRDEDLAPGPDGPKNPIEALVVWQTHALSTGPRDLLILVSAASPIRRHALARLGIGRPRVGKVEWKKGRLRAEVERVHAGKVLATTEEEPKGELARIAITDLVARGRLFKGTAAKIEAGLAAHALGARITQMEGGRWTGAVHHAPELADEGLKTWLPVHLENLGLECGGDLSMLSAKDLLPDALPENLAAMLARDWPPRVSIGGIPFDVQVNPAKREVTLIRRGGKKGAPVPPRLIPTFRGFRVLLEEKGTTRVLRAR